MAFFGGSNKSHFEREPSDNYFSRKSCTPEVDLPVYSINGARDTPSACLFSPSQDALQAGMQNRGGNDVEVSSSPDSPAPDLEEPLETWITTTRMGRVGPTRGMAYTLLLTSRLRVQFFRLLSFLLLPTWGLRESHMSEPRQAEPAADS